MYKLVKMVVEIWSDVVCPFCYIGKKRFEQGLSQFAHRSEVEVRWKSYLLNPGMSNVTRRNLHEYLAEIKGISVDEAKRANQQVSKIASDAGLHFDMDRAIPANSMSAHRLLQLARVYGLSNEMEERLFKAYFTEGKDIADKSTLAELASEAGLDTNEVHVLLESDKHTDLVEQDLYEARQIGVNAVPYFVIDDRYAVRGAQAPEAFFGALNKAWEERTSDKGSV